jgi:hypothetical protein
LLEHANLFTIFWVSLTAYYIDKHFLAVTFALKIKYLSGFLQKFININNYKTMKKLISAFALVLASVAFVNAQAVMTLETTTIDYGKIDKGSERVRKFKFTNTGNEPLIIKSAKGSCGCTVPSYPKEPSMPGETGTIDVNYDTNREGMFTKTVTITTNEATDTHTLTIKGEVKPAAAQESVPAGTNGLQKG